MTKKEAIKKIIPLAIAMLDRKKTDIGSVFAVAQSFAVSPLQLLEIAVGLTGDMLKALENDGTIDAAESQVMLNNLLVRLK